MSSDSGHPNPDNSPFKRLNNDGIPQWESPQAPLPADPFTASSSVEPVAFSIDSAPATASTVIPGTRPGRAKVWALAGVIGGATALAAIGGGAYYAYNQFLGHDDRSTAAYAPANSYGYAALNVDPTSRAWLDAWNLARRVGLDDELRELPAQLESESGQPGMWENLIKPAIGREVGFAAWPDATGADAEPHVAAIVMIADEAKAREAMANLLEDEEVEDATYREFTYQHSPDGDGAGGIVDDALILTDSSEAFEDAVDAYLDGGLDENDAFNAAADRAGDDPLFFAWADSTAIADVAQEYSENMLSDGDMDMIVPVLPGVSSSSVDEAVEQYRSLGDVTVTLKADDDALRMVALTEGRPGNFPTTAAGERFAAEMPASTLFYMGSSDMYANVFQPLFTQLERFSDDSGSSDGMESIYGVPTIDDLEEMLGFNVEDDFLAHFAGPYAIGVDAHETPGGMAEFGGSFHLYSDIDDEAAVADTLDTITDTLTEQGLPIVRQDDGFAFAAAGVQAEVSIENGALHLSGSYNDTGDATGSLTNDPDYQRAMDGMADDASLTGYIALHRILDMVPESEWSDADADAIAALEALGPMAWSSGPDGDGTRTEMVLFVDGE